MVAQKVIFFTNGNGTVGLHLAHLAPMMSFLARSIPAMTLTRSSLVSCCKEAEVGKTMWIPLQSTSTTLYLSPFGGIEYSVVTWKPMCCCIIFIDYHLLSSQTRHSQSWTAFGRKLGQSFISKSALLYEPTLPANHVTDLHRISVHGWLYEPCVVPFLLWRWQQSDHVLHDTQARFIRGGWWEVERGKQPVGTPKRRLFSPEGCGEYGWIGSVSILAVCISE